MQLSCIAVANSPEYKVLTAPGRLPIGLTVDGEGWLWSADTATDQIHRINPATGDSAVAVLLAAPQHHLRGIAIGGGSLWIGLVGKSTGVSFVRKIALTDLPPPGNPVDWENFDLLHSGPADHNGDKFEGIAYSNIDGVEELWIAFGPEIRVYDANTPGLPKRTYTPDFPRHPKGLFHHDDRLWVVTHGNDRRLYHMFFTESDVLIVQYPVYWGENRGIAIVDGELWVTDVNLATITRYAYDLDNLFTSKYVPADKVIMQGVLDYDAAGTPQYGLWAVPYLSSHPLPATMGGPVYNEIKRVVLTQHGSGSGAEGAFRNAIASARFYDDAHNVVIDPSNVLGETLFLSIQKINSGEVERPGSPLDRIEFPFINAQVPASSPFHAYWTDGGRFWGSRCWGDRGVSAFAAADILLQRAVDACPNLDQIVICGHSGGGQFAQRYAALSCFEDDVAIPQGIAMRYVPMNPGNYLYFNSERFQPVPNLFGEACGAEGIIPPPTDTVTWVFPPVDFADWTDQELGLLYGLCAGDDINEVRNEERYNRYGLGLETFFHDNNPMTYQYAWKDRAGSEQYRDPDVHGTETDSINDYARNEAYRRYRDRCVFHCIGTEDAEIVDCGEETSIPLGEADRMQGCNRYQRARILFSHLRRAFPNNTNHSLYEVPGIGHSSVGMYTHQSVQECLFGDHCHATGSWLSDYAPSSPPDKRHPLFDLDLDGKSNQLERFQNTPPHLPDGRSHTLIITEEAGMRYLEFDYRHSLTVPDLAGQVWAVSGLEDFGSSSATEAIEISRTPIDSETEQVRVRDPLPMGAPGSSGGPVARFLRLEVGPSGATGGPQ